MPTRRFRASAERRERLVREAIAEFSTAYAQASLSQRSLAGQGPIAKGKPLPVLPRTSSTSTGARHRGGPPRHKREFVGVAKQKGYFWEDFESLIERGMAFLGTTPEARSIDGRCG